MRPASALARRAFRDARVRTISFACLFALYAYIQPVGYRHAYPTRASRLAFARSFGNNKAIRLFYGEPHNLLSVSGYSAWRVGGTLAIFSIVTTGSGSTATWTKVGASVAAGCTVVYTAAAANSTPNVVITTTGC